MLERDLNTGFVQEFEAAPEAVGHARQAVEVWMADHTTLDDRQRHDVALIVSELGTNAIEAAPSGRFVVELRWAGRLPLVVRVVNDTELSHVPTRAEWGPDTVLAVRGRGLAIVEALSSQIDVDRSEPGRVTVTVLYG